MSFRIAAFAALTSSLIVAPAWSAVLVQDNFNNRTANSNLVGSTTSDGNGVWDSDNGNGNAKIIDDSGDKLVNLNRSNKRFYLNHASGGNAYEMPNGSIEVDYRYIQSYSDNGRFELAYRLGSPNTNLTSGGDQAGYQLTMKATNSNNNQDTLNFHLETDAPNDGDKNPVTIPNTSYTLTKPDIVAGNSSTPGEPVHVRIDFNGSQHTLYVDGSQAFSVTDDTYPVSSLGNAYFNVHNGGYYRTRGFDNIKISAIPEPATLGLMMLGGLVASTRRRRC